MSAGLEDPPHLGERAGRVGPVKGLRGDDPGDLGVSERAGFEAAVAPLDAWKFWRSLAHGGAWFDRYHAESVVDEGLGEQPGPGAELGDRGFHGFVALDADALEQALDD